MHHASQWDEGVHVVICKDSGADIRPITVSPIIGKLFEIVIDTRMQFIENAFNTGDVFNGRFVKHSTTTDKMFILLGCIQKQLSKGRTLYVTVVGFQHG